MICDILTLLESSSNDRHVSLEHKLSALVENISALKCSLHTTLEHSSKAQQHISDQHYHTVYVEPLTRIILSVVDRIRSGVVDSNGILRELLDLLRLYSIEPLTSTDRFDPTFMEPCGTKARMMARY